MNRKVSVWKRMFFKSNIGRIRKAIMDYLQEEGINVSFEDGLLVITLDDYHYSIDFDVDNDYPLCCIIFRLCCPEYKDLELSQKTFIADKINTNENRHSIVKSFTDEIVVDTHFYFNSKSMLLILFHDYFVDLKETVDEMADWLADAIKENKHQRHPIGFMATATSQEKNCEVQPAACGKNDTK